ncbi:MAG: hypothetical protein LQ345_004105 [Seirophora villosa]|nr:MAG: hypothetical protein LQ345_004105 [Seirophora villosa]
MAKRKPDTDHPEHDANHRSKKTKTHDGTLSAEVPAAAIEQNVSNRPDQQSLKDDRKKIKDAKRRATKIARRQRRNATAAVPKVLQNKPEVADDEPGSERPSETPRTKLPKQQRRSGQGQSQNASTAPQTAQQRSPKAGVVKAKAVASSKTQQPHTRARAHRNKRRPMKQQHRTAKGKVQKTKNYGSGNGDGLEKRGKSPFWSVSEASGGQMANLDPVFSYNEEHLLVADQSSVNVYSTATSLLIRKLRLGHSARLSAFAFSSTDPSHLYVATESGIIQLWHWLDGQKIHFWNTKCHIHALTTSKIVDNDQSSNTVYTVNHKETGSWSISAHRLGTTEDELNNDAVTLRISKEPISALKIVGDGRVIVATSGVVLTIGISDHSMDSTLSDRSYTWRDVECPDWISCVDVRIVATEDTSKKSKGTNEKQVPRVDIVVGGLKGPIHVYDDLLRRLMRSEKVSDKGTELTSRKKHWHRNAVLSVKWSRDGNYIISGGLETVMLIWQLETGSLDTLPHLGAPVEGIVVSPSGSSYAVRLADKSAMILSTSELKPTFSIAGIQTPGEEVMGDRLPFVSSVDSPVENVSSLRRLRSPVVHGPTGLLCAVPSATSSRLPAFLPPHASYLQTYDIASAHQISKQAMTRTKATDLNLGPESNTIEEPDVILMQISHDGQWLATVDQWMPPRKDMDPVTYNEEQAIDEQKNRKEIYLKFWSWNNDGKVWELASRVDDPHASQVGIADERNLVLDLVMDPSSNTFATVGEDCTVRIWSPSSRRRHGLAVKDRAGQELTVWKCQSTISLECRALPLQKSAEAKLAYSLDGSCLAVAYTRASPWTIYFVDTIRGTVRTGPYGPFTGSMSGLEIVDKYLILLSDQLYVWNLVTEQLVYGFELERHALRLKSRVISNHMTADAQGGTFAVALQSVGNAASGRDHANLGSKIMIFEASNPTPIFVQELSHSTIALTRLYKRPGYLAIDSAAEIRTLAPMQAKLDPSTTLLSPPATPSRGLREIYGDPKNNDGVRTEEARKRIAESIPGISVEPWMDNDDANVVSQEKLSEVFGNGPAYAMPPITELFERVARLFAGKTED